jgi:DNA-binding NarL/FixJ family response regulator
VRVALAEDGMLFREGVARLLGEAGFEVTARCENADELLREIDAAPPDVAILDIRMPPTHTDEGMRAALEIRERHPSVGVLVLSQYVETGLAMQLLADSVEGVGYLLKERVGDMADFTAAVRRVGSGGSAIDPAIVGHLLSRHRDTDPLQSITPRERDVLELMAEGRSNQGIADRLEVTERAVQKHITSIFVKLGLTVDDDDHRRVLAVLAYLRTNPAG